MHKLLTFFISLSIVLLPSVIFGQTTCTDQIAGKSRAQLERELEACDKEIAEWTETLNKTKRDSASFVTDIAALTAKINAARANIKAKNTPFAILLKDFGKN